MIACVSKKWNNYYSKKSDLKVFLGALFIHIPLFIEIYKLHPRYILEVGIGKGSMSIILGLLGFKVIGIDNSDYLVSLATKCVRKMHLYNRVSFILGDVFKLNDIFSKSEILVETKFDCCFSQGFFEHFNDEEIKKIINEQLKVAKVVIFSVPSNFYPSQDFGDERLLSLDEWKKILKDFNVGLIKYYGRLHSFYFGFKDILLKQKFNFPYFKPLHILVKIKHCEG